MVMLREQGVEKRFLAVIVYGRSGSLGHCSLLLELLYIVNCEVPVLRRGQDSREQVLSGLEDNFAEGRASMRLSLGTSKDTARSPIVLYPLRKDFNA